MVRLLFITAQLLSDFIAFQIAPFLSLPCLPALAAEPFNPGGRSADAAVHSAPPSALLLFEQSDREVKGRWCSALFLRKEGVDLVRLMWGGE